VWRLLPVAHSEDVVIVSSYLSAGATVASIAAPRGFVDFIEELVRRGRNPIVVSLGNPYFVQQVPEVPAYVVAWGGFAVSQRAAARALLGRIPIDAHLPISIPPVAHLGDGLTRAAISASATGARR
jgi:beta-N-acetylhexosaminidase